MFVRTLRHFPRLKKYTTPIRRGQWAIEFRRIPRLVSEPTVSNTLHPLETARFACPILSRYRQRDFPQDGFSVFRASTCCIYATGRPERRRITLVAVVVYDTFKYNGTIGIRRIICFERRDKNYARNVLAEPIMLTRLSNSPT